MIPMSLTQTAPTPTIIQGAFTYHLDSTAIIKNKRPFTIDPKAIKSNGTIFSINASAFKNAKKNVYSLVTDAVISKSEGILTPDSSAFVKNNKCYTVDPTALVDTANKAVYVSPTAKKAAAKLGKKLLLAEVSS